jgi:hypothetical protein
VKVAAPVLRKWDEISEEEKVAFQRAADEAVMRRLTAKPWRHEGHLYKSIDAAERALEHLFKVNRTPHDRGETISSRPEQDPDKLRDAAKTLKRAAKELCRRADSIEKPYSGSNPIPELQSILGHHWVYPSGICLCWMSYPVLAKFLRLTVPSLEALTATALEQECRRLKLPKLRHPLVEEGQIYRAGKVVYLDGGGFSCR